MTWGTQVKFNVKVGAIVALSLFVSGCVAPNVVQEKTVTDENLTCEQIQTQLGQLEEIRTEARKGKTASGTNVAAAIFFWPAVIGNYANANEALEAADKRNLVLVDLAKKKRCKF